MVFISLAVLPFPLFCISPENIEKKLCVCAMIFLSQEEEKCIYASMETHPPVSKYEAI
jgi:hypothetical protein